MTDEEIQAWHMGLTDIIQSPPKLAAHMREVSGGSPKAKKHQAKQYDLSEFSVSGFNPEVASE